MSVCVCVYVCVAWVGTCEVHNGGGRSQPRTRTRLLVLASQNQKLTTSMSPYLQREGKEEMCDRSYG